VHWVINMFALRFVGAAIEMSHGWFASFLIFSLSAIGGIILSAIFLPDTISVGASGGIFGACACLVRCSVYHRFCTTHGVSCLRRFYRSMSSRHHYELESIV
jgi:membrane associated rhomboid family serine protease